MNLANSNIPLLMASLAFLVICLLSLGLIVFFRSLAYRRALLDKIQPMEEGFETDMVGASPDKPMRGWPFYLSIINKLGVKTNPGRSYDDADVRLKFARAGLRDKNFPTLFWGVKFLMAVTFRLFTRKPQQRPPQS